MKKVAVLMMVVLMMTMAVGTVMAKEKMAPKMHALTGDVAKVDAAAGKITITVAGKAHHLKGEPKLLEGVAVGEKVMVEVVGNNLKSIKKIEAPAAPAVK
jgi:hypothetical protein